MKIFLKQIFVKIKIKMIDNLGNKIQSWLLKNEKKQICCIGAGYVGGPTWLLLLLNVQI